MGTQCAEGCSGDREKRAASAMDCRPLPCPFCGSEDLDVCSYGIECRKCGAWMGESTHREVGKTLLGMWNTRRGNTAICGDSPHAAVERK